MIGLLLPLGYLKYSSNGLRHPESGTSSHTNAAKGRTALRARDLRMQTHFPSFTCAAFGAIFNF